MKVIFLSLSILFVHAITGQSLAQRNNQVSLLDGIKDGRLSAETSANGN